MIRRTITLVGVLVIASISPLVAQTNIEKNFTRANNADFSGSFTVTGVTDKEEEYSGSIKLSSWNTLTTPMGNVLQQYKLEYQFGETKSNGVAVFDGHRLYFASGEGKANTYYLMLISKLEFAQVEHTSLFNYKEGNRKAKEGEYMKWKGKAPWYGFLDLEVAAYGYWFWADGIWGQYSTRRNGFPHTSDTGIFTMLELKKDGGFGKMSGLYLPDGYYEAGWMLVEPEGENVHINVGWTTNGKKKGTWGGGMMTADPVTGDSLLVAMIGGPDNSSFGWFEISGKSLVGVWAQGGESRGTETIELTDAVIEKNSAWFK